MSLGPATQVTEPQAHGSGVRFDVRLNHYMELHGLDAPCEAVMLFAPLPESTAVFPISTDARRRLERAVFVRELTVAEVVRVEAHIIVV